MGTYAFEANALVKIDGTELRLDRKVTGTLWQLEKTANKETFKYEDAELLAKYDDGSLVFVNTDDGDHCGSSKIELSPEDHEIAKLRLQYVKATLDIPNSRTTLELVITTLWAQIKMPNTAPGYISVYLWKKRYLGANCDYRTLVNRTARKGNRTPQYPQAVIEICDQAIQSKYLRRERNTIEKTLEDAHIRINQANKLLLPSLQLKLPTRRLLQRLVNKIPAYDKHAARYGYQAARKAFRSVKGHVVTERPLERAEIDHTQLDIVVVDEQTAQVLGRPYVTVCIDDFSRCILGIYIGFNSPSYLNVQLCLSDCFRPKSWLREEYPEINSEWPAAGIMDNLVVDGGLEFHGTSLEKMCLSRGINIVTSPRLTPTYKGKIERVLGTLNRAVSEGVPGTAFRSITEKGDYDSQKHACLTLSALKKNVMQWIADVYHQKLHRSLDTTPSKMWQANICPEDIRYPAESSRFDAVMGSATQKTLTHKGIQYEGLSYNSHELSELRRQWGTNLKVDVRVNQMDIGSIYVIVPDRREPLEVPSLEPTYAQGLSLHAHQVIRKLQRDNADMDQGAEGRRQVTQDMNRRIAEAKTSKKRKLGRRYGQLLEGTEKTQAGRAQRESVLVATPRTGSSATDKLLLEFYPIAPGSNGLEGYGSQDSSDDLPDFEVRDKG
ncbi:MAG TPA: Mu transposase C-terminal domain-containing protein [Acidobacteriaceae bacterium]|nr:Mu transposase C-terminal domain-containing protein [Acidobacteriaceae bacterium]